MNDMTPVALVDGYGRRHRDLRISITDRCNFRCTYCMPEEGMKYVARDEILSFEEIERIARICVEHFGFESIRLTGGEPTVRAHLPVLVERLSRLNVDLAMTTNGSTLSGMANDLRRAGLDRINISCDSLRPDRFEALTRRDGLDAVLKGIDAALAAGFDRVKLNVVALRGENDDEIVDFATFGRSKGIEVRFIEYMPLDADHGWTRAAVVPGEEIISRIAQVYPLRPLSVGSDPAALFEYVDGLGRVGVIPSVTEPFCSRCDRVRLSAEGAMRNCLFALDEIDLREVMRSGGTDDELASNIERCVGAKWVGHQVGSVTFVQPPRSMSQIGG